MSHTSRTRLLAAFATVYLGWGSTYLAIRYAVDTLPPFLLAGTRFLVAGAVLFAWDRSRNRDPIPWIEWRNAILTGGLLFVGANGLVTWAEQQVPSALAALAVAAVPLWLVVFDSLHPRGSRPSIWALLGIALGFVGQLVLFGNSLGGHGLHLPSVLALFVAPLAWGLGSVLSRYLRLPKSRVRLTAMQCLGGGALLMLLSLLSGDAARLVPNAVAWHSVSAWLYLVVVGTMASQLAYTWLLGNVEPARVGTYAYVNPVVAVLLGWLLAGEALTVRTLIASAVVVAAVVIVNMAPKRAAAPKPVVVGRTDPPLPEVS